MAVNGSEIRDTACVLRISPTTVGIVNLFHLLLLTYGVL